MKSSLFRDRPARKTRMTMMVAGTTLIHFAVVGVGAMWQPLEKEPPDVFQDFLPTVLDRQEPPDGILVVVSTPVPAQAPVEQTPSDVLPTLSAQPPEAAALEMPEPAEIPPPKPRHLPPRTVNISATADSMHAASGGSGALAGGPGETAGVPGGGRASALNWKTPKPPYPRTTLSSRMQGATTVRITTDANGNVSTVQIVRSAGNPVLDYHTQAYVREFWKGPPNATRTTEFVYQVP